LVGKGDEIMSTYANISINGQPFHVEHDGGDKEDIKYAIENYVHDWKDRVNKEDIPEIVIAILIRDAFQSPYCWIQPEFVDFVSYTYQVNIEGNKVKIKEEDAS
jgi:hypothetical protein